jgi:hypothetical protein
MEIMDREQSGHGFKRKAVSSALGRLADENKELQQLAEDVVVNGRPAKTYIVTEKFPPARP